jgi:DNA-binding NarL/FixJ family response regulator
MTGGPAAGTEAIRIVVADDHAVVREGVRRVLDDEPGFSVVGEASSGREVLRVIEETAPDVVLLDLGLPGIGGLEIVRRLRQAGPDPRVLILSMHDEKEYVVQAAAAGVDGYLLKDEAEPKMLRAAVRAVHEGDSYFSATAAAALAGAVRSRSAAARPDPLDDLTDRETEVLCRVASGRTNKEMAAELGISPRTVETHRENLMRKLSIHSVAGLTRFALERGLLGSD